MNVSLSQRAVVALASSSPAIQKTFIKQINLLLRDLRHPGLHAKKYDEANGVWQGRINDDWRFWFRIQQDTYHVIDLGPHPK